MARKPKKAPVVSKIGLGVNQLEQMKTHNETVAETGTAKTGVRKNFVRINQMKNYKPALRGAAFTNKIMAKKANSVKAKMRFAKRLNIE